MIHAGAVFLKQGLDMRRNPMTLIQFLVFPVVAFVFTLLVARPDPDIPDTLFVSMFAAIFAGLSVTTTVAAVIAEDKERASWKFLALAGVRPQEYLLGVGGFVGAVGAVVALVFALMGGFPGVQFVRFWGVLVLGVVASVLLGATLGLLARNQQAATATAMPVAMILGFGPLLAQFNPALADVFAVFYTQRVASLANDPSADLVRPLLVIAANIAVLAGLFVLAYRATSRRPRADRP